MNTLTTVNKAPRRRTDFFVSLGITAMLGIVPMQSHAQSTDNPSQSAKARSAIEQLATDSRATKISVSEQTGLISFISSPGIDAKRTLGVNSGNPAVDFVASYATAFGISGARDLKVKKSSRTDEVGMQHVRMQQNYRGVPITGGEVTVHMRNGSVVAANAKTLDMTDGFDILPTITGAQAQSVVLGMLQKHSGITDATLTEPRLELFNRGLLENRDAPTRLAWFIEANRIDVRQVFWIDAENGTPILNFDQLTDAKNRHIHDADDPGDGLFNVLPGALVRSEGQGSNGDPEADNAYDFSGDAYDYFANTHGRDSYDDAGADLISTVNFCPSSANCPYFNAFWNGTQMVYGTGLSVDDVAAHELTHAVTERTAGLFYYMQSGALNESYSDIFGEIIDLGNGAGDDSPGVRWLIGEDISGAGAFRSMSDPTLYGDPGKMSDPQFVCADPGGDLGGVHSNSGVPNHAFELMVDGGTYNGITVYGIGVLKAGKIQYRALTEYLLSASDFQDNYNALLQSCDDLVGTSGISTGNCAQVKKALDAVEMNDPWPCGSSTVAFNDFCPAGLAADVAHYQDFTSPVVPTCPANGLPADWCINDVGTYLGPFASSGDRSAWGYNLPTTNIQTMSAVASNSLPANSYMTFNHAHSFEDSGGGIYYDGGILDYTTNGGASYINAGSLISEGAAYGGNITATFDNPRAGDPAFVAGSFGYNSTKVDLSTLANMPFTYRFSVSTDSIIDDYGWWIDDVRVYHCDNCVPNWNLTNAHTGTADLYQASNSITASTGFNVGVQTDVEMVAPTVVLDNGFSVGGGELVVRNVQECI